MEFIGRDEMIPVYASYIENVHEALDLAKAALTNKLVVYRKPGAEPLLSIEGTIPDFIKRENVTTIGVRSSETSQLTKKFCHTIKVVDKMINNAKLRHAQDSLYRLLKEMQTLNGDLGDKGTVSSIAINFVNVAHNNLLSAMYVKKETSTPCASSDFDYFGKEPFPA